MIEGIIIDKLTKENEILKIELSKAKADGKLHQNEMVSLKEDVKDKEHQVLDLKKRNEKLSLKQTELDQRHKDERNKLQMQNKNTQLKDVEVKLLKQQVVTLTEQLNERETELEDTLKTLNEKDWNEKPSEKESGASVLLTEMQKMIDIKFRNMESTVSNIVEKKLEEKQVANTDKVKLSFAEVLEKSIEKKNATVENAIKSSQNNERVLETERSKREKNIMIHGIPENENEESDKEYIASFLQVLGTNVVPESATRLGRSENNSTETSRKKKSRPLKLSMKTVADKDQIMRRLSNLKKSIKKLALRTIIH